MSAKSFYYYELGNLNFPRNQYQQTFILEINPMFGV